ncbi:MAG: ribonuclease III [Woeseia sp.]
MSEDQAASWLHKTLSYQFADERLLADALSHRSASGASNERLEFLGDAILDFVISDAVYQRRPAANEGDLSRLRASLVNDVALGELAAALGIGEHIRLGSGEKKTGGHRRSSILADALEALFGAVYLDRGYAAVSALILSVYEERLAALPDAEDLKDPKTRLQEKLQAHGHELPEYEVTRIAGKPHRRQFTVICRIAALSLEREGVGTSRRGAEQQAAETMLSGLESQLRQGQSA